MCSIEKFKNLAEELESSLISLVENIKIEEWVELIPGRPYELISLWPEVYYILRFKQLPEVGWIIHGAEDRAGGHCGGVGFYFRLEIPARPGCIRSAPYRIACCSDRWGYLGKRAGKDTYTGDEFESTVKAQLKIAWDLGIRILGVTCSPRHPMDGRTVLTLYPQIETVNLDSCFPLRVPIEAIYQEHPVYKKYYFPFLPNLEYCE